MRAIVYRAYGRPDQLELTEMPRPIPTSGQVLVRVAASSVNPIDWKRASGKLRFLMPTSFPMVPGYDIAGEVAETGPGVTSLSVGDKVHAHIGDSKGGASADYAIAGVDVVAKMPSGMDPGEAAGLPLAGMTALQGLRDQAGLALKGAHDRVLVVGASGGVGHLAVQLARSTGATVIGVSSARNAALVTELGAHEVLDYTKPEPYRGQAPFDIVLDCVAGDPAPWLPLLGPAGRYVSCLPGPAVFARAALNPFCGKKVRPVLLKSRGADLEVLDRLVAAGTLRVVVDARFSLEDLGKAWERSMTGRAAGKIVSEIAKT